MEAQGKAKAALTFALYQGDQLLRRETLAQDMVKIGKDPRGHLRIDDEQAAVVREIKRRSAAGESSYRIAADLDRDGAARLGRLTALLRRRIAELATHYDAVPSLQDRTVGTGVARPEFVRRFAAGGFVGRASGRAFDARKALPYPPYDALTFQVPVLGEGDVNARVWIRLREIQERDRKSVV